jgi:hypothetical protein
MGITFKAFHECVGFVASARKPILLRSRHGVGKSEVVYDFAKSINMKVIERRASQMTEGDLLGLPKLDNQKTEWIPPGWLYNACQEPVVLFIDEIDRATPEVRQGFFELTDSRKIAGWELHKDTLVFAAINGGEYAAQYQVGEMDPAELSRWTVFDLEPDVEDWLAWSRKDDHIHPVIIDFISTNHKHLEHTNDFEPNKIYPCRRSWHRLSDCLKGGDLIQPGEVNPVLFNLTQAFVGLEAAVSFTDFVREYSRQILPEDIFNGKIELTKDFTINDHSSLIDKIVSHNVLKNKIEDEKILENLADYFVSLPSECAMSFWIQIGQACQANCVKIHKVNGNKVQNYMIKILRSGEVDLEKVKKQ